MARALRVEYPGAFYHLINRGNAGLDANLSHAIKWVNVSYACYFNRKRKRSGHLFQRRYKVVLVDAD